MGNYANALPLYRQALDIERRVLGPEHRETVEQQVDLGDLYRFIGEYGKAAAVAGAGGGNRPPDAGSRAHPDTLCSFTNLAWLYESMGDYVKACAAVRKRHCEAAKRRLTRKSQHGHSPQ